MYIKIKPCVSLVLARKSLSAVGPHIPLPCKIGQALLKEAIRKKYIHKETMDSHYLIRQLANSFF